MPYSISQIFIALKEIEASVQLLFFLEYRLSPLRKPSSWVHLWAMLLLLMMPY